MAFDEIKAKLASSDPEVRGRAMQGLLDVVRKDARVHQEALAIFMGAIEHEAAPWAMVSAARGVACIAGEQEGRRAWRRLLNHPHDEVVGAAVSVVDAAMAPAQLEVLERRTDKTVQIPALRVLGRLKYAPSFDAIVQRLREPALRPHRWRPVSRRRRGWG